METLVNLMRRRFPVDMEAAARLGISRQAYSQAIKRGRFSNETALRCADLLTLDRAAALLANCPAAEHMPAPVSNPRPETTDEKKQAAPPALYYVKYYIGVTVQGDTAPRTPKTHFPGEYPLGLSNGDIKGEFLHDQNRLKKVGFFLPGCSGNTFFEQLVTFHDGRAGPVCLDRISAEISGALRV